MARKLDLIPCQATLFTPLSNNTLLTESSAIVVNVEGDVELLVLGILLETLLAVPSGVLDGEESSVGRQEEVKTTDSDDGVVGMLDDALEHIGLSGREGSVAAAGFGITETKYIIRSALIPGHIGGSVEGLLDVCAVEVDLGTGRRIVTLYLLALVCRNGRDELTWLTMPSWL